MLHSSSSLAGSSPSSLFLGVLGVGVVWKGLFKKGPEGPLARPNSCPAVPLVAHPHHNPQPLTKALTSQQKCVQQRQQLLYSCNERSLFLGSQGDARGSFQSVWGYWLRLKNILSAAKIKKKKEKLPKFLWMWCNVKWMLISRSKNCISKQKDERWFNSTFSHLMHCVTLSASPSRSSSPSPSSISSGRSGRWKGGPSEHERQCVGSQVDLQAFLLSCIFIFFIKMGTFSPIHL